jgi:nicotinate-nucleotide adenylyltransferase
MRAPASMMGVLGGTFDPVHFGHLRPALEVCQDLGLREVRLVPLRQAVHRPQPLASPDQRLAMLRLAVAGEPGLGIDDRELRRVGPSYSYDTLVDLRAELGAEEGICACCWGPMPSPAFSPGTGRMTSWGWPIWW